jgi:surface protein
MIDVIIIYHRIETIIQYNKDAIIKNICEDFRSDIDADKNSLYFLFGKSHDNQINNDNRLFQILGKEKKELIIYAYDKNNIITIKYTTSIYQMIFCSNFYEVYYTFRIFGKTFVENNLFICKIYYKGNEYELKEYSDDIEEIKNKDVKKFEIKLIGISEVINMDGLFEDCPSLIGLPDILNWDTTNVYSMNDLFKGCLNLKFIDDISKWNTSNVYSMINMFYYCKSLTILPDISVWKLNNVNDLSGLFYKCKSLSSISDII